MTLINLDLLVLNDIYVPYVKGQGSAERLLMKKKK